MYLICGTLWLLRVLKGTDSLLLVIIPLDIFNSQITFAVDTRLQLKDDTRNRDREATVELTAWELLEAKS